MTSDSVMDGEVEILDLVLQSISTRITDSFVRKFKTYGRYPLHFTQHCGIRIKLSLLLQFLD